ncbi:SseB family protein [Intrasporangium sp.]|uniref:SseB family protein n=1 Tax=Intrasporangium sp. TaxID=1925024 RepID=UPI002939A818|nr:SseB family protein [Intrasporangium sp.]MDV3221689.1 SseB family protein [Intrasporangium sp.]
MTARRRGGGEPRGHDRHGDGQQGPEQHDHDRHGDGHEQHGHERHGHLDAEGRPSDSAGQAWAGKTIPSHGFADDRGEADPGLVAALLACAAEPTPDAETELLSRVAAVRWLVPVVAIPTEVDEKGGLVTDTRSDMAAVTLTAPDGRKGLPMFSSLESLAAWDPGARPVPVPASSAAQAAVAESCDVLLVDVSSPHATVLRASMLWALAQDRAWVPAHRDEQVARAVGAAVRDEPVVAGHRLEAGEPAGAGVLRVVLRLPAGLDREVIGEVATRIGERIATDGETRARIDALTFALEAVT